jgi:tellurite resistance protein
LSEPTAEPRLRHLPVSFFSMVMGLSGLAIAWHKAQATFDLPVDLATPILMLAGGLFCVLLTLYLTKLVRYRAAVVAELGHPVHLNFFPTISVSLLLLAVGTLPHWPGAAGVLWVLGSSLHLLLTLYVMGVWIHHQHFEIHHINPAWFIPMVGNVLVPIAGVPLGFTEIAWFFFSIGILFWLILFTIIVYRMLFHHPLAERLMPTFFILIAPPAVGFIAYLQLTGTLDPFARVLYHSGLFLTLLLATQVGRFLRIPFYLSWWAYAFPLAAIAIATLVMYEQTRVVAFAGLAWVLLTLVTLVVVYLLAHTAGAVAARRICVPAQ